MYGEQDRDSRGKHYSTDGLRERRLARHPSVAASRAVRQKQHPAQQLQGCADKTNPLSGFGEALGIEFPNNNRQDKHGYIPQDDFYYQDVRLEREKQAVWRQGEKLALVQKGSIQQ